MYAIRSYYEPVVPKDEVQGVTILYGQAGEAGQPLLLDGGEAQFLGDLQDLLAEESGPLLLWQSLAAEDQPRESVSQTEALLAEDMLSDASPCLPELDLFHHQHRITSYNVCYTKLLRSRYWMMCRI